jgi:hypothetical protein
MSAYTTTEISRDPTGKFDTQGREIVEVVTERYRTLSSILDLPLDDATKLGIEMAKRINKKRDEISDLEGEIKELQLFQRLFSVIARDTPVK